MQQQEVAETGSAIGPLVEWYRPDPQGQIYRIWALGSLMVVLGAICAGLALWAEKSLGVTARAVIGIVGGFCVLGGPLAAMIRFIHAMRDETYLVLGKAGIQLALAGEALIIPWENLQSARYDESLVLALRDGQKIDVFVQFADIEGGKLARRIDHLRAKAQMGLF